jgi:hypothetical protein
MIDLVVDRREMKATIASAFRFMGARPGLQPRPAPTPGAELVPAPDPLRDEAAPRVP